MTNSTLLTIVIPTRDRPDLLGRCLRSIFERQTTIPPVIVSDNSTANNSAVQALRRRYPFTYLRQSGEMSMADHHNLCLSLPSTRWMMLLHDDDELYPGCLKTIESVLPGVEGPAVIVGGLQYVDPDGTPYWTWAPARHETLKGDDGLLKLCLDFQTRSPNTVFSIEKSRQIGGLPHIDGVVADYTFFGTLAYLYGVEFCSEYFGCYRTGHEQFTDVTSPEKSGAHLRYCAEMAKLLRNTGCSAVAADRLLDDMTWGVFLVHAARWQDSEPEFVARLCKQCLILSPESGQLQAYARMKYPLLFWPPQLACATPLESERH